MEAFTAPPLEIPPEIAAMLAANAPIAVGVSGGKDGTACALAVSAHLDAIGHTGPRVLIHSDLGAVEWQDSGPSCRRLHAHLEATSGRPWEYVTVKRPAGGMMERWESRWESSKRRYQGLECVKVILPWSTPAMRFCTSELKNDQITSWLNARFGATPVISVTGIRAEESKERAKRQPAGFNPKLNPGGMDWHAILRWKIGHVFAQIQASGLRLHEAYDVFGASRVSCVFCIMSAAADLQAGLRDPRNHAIYCRMCALEIASGFAFQGGATPKWLAGLRPDLVDQAALQGAQALARRRQEIEARIPKHLEFTKGWPHSMPTPEEAALLGTIRAEIAALYGWHEMPYVTSESIRERYAALMATKREREARKAAAAARKAARAIK